MLGDGSVQEDVTGVRGSGDGAGNGDGGGEGGVNERLRSWEGRNKENGVEEEGRKEAGREGP